MELGAEKVGSKTMDLGDGDFDTSFINTLCKTTDGLQVVEAIKAHMKNDPHRTALSGMKPHAITYPPSFVYKHLEKEGIADEPSFDGLQKRMDRLLDKTSKDEDDEKELKFITRVIKHYKPQFGEITLNQLLESFLSEFSSKFLLLSSFKMQRYLESFIEKAKTFRGNRFTIPLTDIEKSLLEVCNIPITDINKWVDDQMRKIRTAALTAVPKKRKSGSSDITGKLILQALPPGTKGGEFDCLKGKFNKSERYSEDDITNILIYARYCQVISYDGEFDSLVTVPDQKLILDLEQKTRVKSAKKCGSQQPDLKHASEQLKERFNYIKRTFGQLFSDDWQYIRIAVIAPGYLDWKKICKSCKRCIITNVVEGKDEEDVVEGKDEEQMRNTLRKLWHGLTSIPNDNKKRSYLEYRHFYNQIVGFSKLAFTQKLIGTWNKVQGPDFPLNVSAGGNVNYLPSSSTEPLRYTPDVTRRPMDALKILIFSPEQEELLTNPELFRVIFMTDFGSGKYL